MIHLHLGMVGDRCFTILSNFDKGQFSRGQGIVRSSLEKAINLSEARSMVSDLIQKLILKGEATELFGLVSSTTMDFLRTEGLTALQNFLMRSD